VRRGRMRYEGERGKGGEEREEEKKGNEN